MPLPLRQLAPFAPVVGVAVAMLAPVVQPPARAAVRPDAALVADRRGETRPAPPAAANTTPRRPRLERAEPLRWLPDAPRCGSYHGRAFCDGPRRAPVPWGAAAARARRLGLGDHAAAAKLLRSRPRPRWKRALPSLPPGSLRWPVKDGRAGRGVGADGGRHRGVDITADPDAPVHAVADGLVAYADNGIHGYGNLLMVIHGGGDVSVYAHLRALLVFAGQEVRRGQVVAKAGDTGLSRGTHLHFEWHDDGDAVDPMPLFSAARPQPDRRGRRHPRSRMRDRSPGG